MMNDLVDGKAMFKLAAQANERRGACALDLVRSWGADHRAELVALPRRRSRLAPLAAKKKSEESFLSKKQRAERRFLEKQRRLLRQHNPVQGHL